MKKNYIKTFKKIVFLNLLIVLFLNIGFTVSASSGWGFKRNNNHEVPEIGAYEKIIDGLAYYVGKDEKVVYLTFDVGYDNGNLTKILDTLKERKLKSIFFVTGDFVTRFPDLLKRISNEGHLIGNHTYNHKDITKLSFAELEKELVSLSDKVRSVTGKDIDLYFRPPEGTFDRESLENVKKLDYKTIFWSIAYVDWYQDKIQGKEYVMNQIENNLHNGAIILMHSVSPDNSTYLNDIIEMIYSNGYKIESIDKYY